MPKFKVAGNGHESGRPRTKVYQGNSDVHAKSLAEVDGMIVREVVRLPPTPPTDGQRATAAELGINIPTDISSEELSSLISLTTWRDKIANATLRELAAGYGVVVNDYCGKKYLFTQIFQQLSVRGRERDLVAWFAYRVYRELAQDAEGMPISSPRAPEIQAVAARLESDQTVLQSIRRYSGESLVWFGRYTTPEGAVLEGGSNRTTAYRTVAAFVRPLIDACPDLGLRHDDTVACPVERVTLPSPYRHNDSQSRESPTPQTRLGCLGVIAICVIAAGAGTMGTAWLAQLV